MLTVFEGLIGLPDTAGAREAFADFVVFEPVGRAAGLAEELQQIQRPDELRPLIDRLASVPQQYSAACWKAAWMAMTRITQGRGAWAASDLLTDMLAALPDRPSERQRQLGNAVRWAGSFFLGAGPAGIVALLRAASATPELPPEVWRDMLALVRPWSFNETQASQVAELTRGGAFTAQQKIDILLLGAAQQLHSGASTAEDMSHIVQAIQASASPACRLVLLGLVQESMDKLPDEDADALACQLQHSMLQKGNPDAAKKMEVRDRVDALLMLPQSGSAEADCDLLLEEIESLPPTDAAKVLQRKFRWFLDSDPACTKHARLMASCSALLERWRRQPARAPDVLISLARVVERAMPLHPLRNEIDMRLLSESAGLPPHHRFCVLLDMRDIHRGENPGLQQIVERQFKDAHDGLTWETASRSTQAMRALQVALMLPASRSEVLERTLRDIERLPPYELAHALEVIAEQCAWHVPMWKVERARTIWQTPDEAGGDTHPVRQVERLLVLCRGLPPLMRERPLKALESLLAEVRQEYAAPPGPKTLARASSVP